MANALHEIRGVLRGLGRTPRFTVVAVLTFAVGIGANTAVFTLVDDVLLDPMAYPAAERVAVVQELHLERQLRVPAAPARIATWRARTDLFAGVAAWRSGTADLMVGDRPVRVRTGLVDEHVLPVLGVDPLLGRGFAEDETARGRDDVVVLGHAFWRDRMGADPVVLGRSVSLDGRPHTVVGVLPPGTAWPAGVELLVPLVIDEPASRASRAYGTLARLAPGVDASRADAELQALARNLADEFPVTDRGWSASVTSLRDTLVAGAGRTLLLFQGAALLTLLIAAANVAGLSLVRAGARRRELAVRLSLGASRGGLVRLLTLESVLLALAGAVLAVPVSQVALAGLLRLSPVELPRPSAGLDGTVLAVTLALAAAAGLVFGLLPAVRGTRTRVSETLREATASRPAGSARFQSVIVAAEVALTAVLLVGSLLFARSLAAVADIDPGFDGRGVLAVEIEPPRYRYESTAERAVLYRRLEETLAERPGIEAVAFSNHLPLGRRTDFFRFLVEGRPAPESQDDLVAAARAVTPAYFDVLDVDVVAGRALEEADGPESERVVVLNQAMADRYWPGQDPVGGRISVMGPEGPWVRVVGVVADQRSFGVTAEARPEFYLPFSQETWPRAEILVAGPRTGDPLALLEPVRGALAEVDPLLPVSSSRTLDTLVAADRAPWRFQALLAAILGIVALLLSLTGEYALLAYLVHQRRSELAVRSALGASPRELTTLVRGHALRLAVMGTVVGLAAAWALSGRLDGLLWGVDPRDPVSYAVPGALVILIAALSAWAPGRRAAGVRPAEVLRS